MGIAGKVRLLSPEAVERLMMPKVVSLLTQMGEELVARARETRTYADVTGRLSASIGYGIVSDGVLVRTGGFLGGEGESAGLAVLEEVSSSVPSGTTALVLVAGMDYALYVERSGRVVLDGAYHDVNKVFSMLSR